MKNAPIFTHVMTDSVKKIGGGGWGEGVEEYLWTLLLVMYEKQLQMGSVVFLTW